MSSYARSLVIAGGLVGLLSIARAGVRAT